MIPGPMRSMRANSRALTQRLIAVGEEKDHVGPHADGQRQGGRVIGAALGLDRAEELLDLRPIGIGAESQLAVGPRRIERLGTLVVDHELELVHIVDLFDAGQDFCLGRGQQFALGAARSVQNVDELRPLGLHPEQRDLGLLAGRSQQHFAAGVPVFRLGCPGRQAEPRRGHGQDQRAFERTGRATWAHSQVSMA